MKYLIVFALLLTSCKKESNVITFVVQSGTSDVVITDGSLVTDFQNCTPGWELKRDAKPKTHYSIEIQSSLGSEVVIKYNGKQVASDHRSAHYVTP